MLINNDNVNDKDNNCNNEISLRIDGLTKQIRCGTLISNSHILVSYMHIHKFELLMLQFKKLSCLCRIDKQNNACLL